MVWDKALPLGSNALKLGDDDIRANNTALESALNLEHQFATGGSQDGAHKFPIDTLANITTLSSGKPDGWVAFANDISDYGIVAHIMDSGNLTPVDIYQLDLIPRLDARNFWTAGQFATRVLMTPVLNGGVNEFTPDITDGAYFIAAIPGVSKIMIPDGTLGLNYNSTILVHVIQGATGYAVSFESGFASVGGVVPVIPTTANSQTLVQLTKMQSLWQVSVLPDVRVF